MSKTLEKDTLLNKPLTRRDRAYCLEYRFKSRLGHDQGRVQKLVFWFDGNLKAANERIRKHCEIMDYKFIFCYPFIVDLEAREELKSKHEDYDEISGDTNEAG